MRRREWITALAAVLAGGAWFPRAGAVSYPARPVKLLVGAPPGGPSDYLARIYAKAMGAALGGSFVVDYKPGASGTLAAETIARSPADGQALLVSGPAAISAAPHFMKLGYDPAAALAPVCMLGAGAFVLAMHPSVGVRSVRELRDMARARPGSFSYGTGGSGSASHLCMELFSEAIQAKMSHVPYKGEGQAVSDLLAGEIQLMFTAPNVAVRHARAGTLGLLAVTGSDRLATLPEIPTVAESGLAGFEYLAWQVVFAPAATPAPVLAALVSAWDASRTTPAVQDQLLALGMAAPDRLVSGDPLHRFLRAESARLGSLIRSAGIKAQ